MIILKVVGISIVFFLLFSIVYTIAGFFCSIIPKNKNYQNVKKEVEIFLVSDGIHTDFIVPTISSFFNWKNILDDQHYDTKFTKDNFLGIGWGDRGFYLDIPTWSDLTPKVAAKALLVPSKTVMHISSYTESTLPKDKKYFESIHLDVEQYLQLCQYICSYFQEKDNQVQLIPDVGYTPDDNFYESTGTYHAFCTCNFWVNKGLILTGVRMPIWCHWGGGMFYQLKKSYPS